MKRSKVLALAATSVLTVLASSVAMAAVPDTAGTFHGCYAN